MRASISSPSSLKDSSRSSSPKEKVKGWAPSDRHSFTDAAKTKGFKDEYLLETGLCAKYDDKPDLHDRFVERVTFPIHSVSGRVIGFGARTLKSKEEGKPYAKYVNSKESAIYVKNQSLYGIWFAKAEMARKDKCFLVEGYLDVLSMHQLGITNVVASSGTALTDGQIRLIGRFTKNVTIMYDGDEAGQKAALRGIDMFLRQGMNVKVVLIPDGDDPDSYSRISSNEQDFVDFKSSLLLKGTERDPLGRANAINEIADTVADIPDAVKRETYIDFLARKFDIRRTALEERVSSTRARLLTRAGQPLEPGRVNSHSAADNSDQAGQPLEPGRVHSRYAAAEYGLSPTAAPATDNDLSALEENKIMAKAERDLLNFILANGTTPLEFQSDSEFYSEDEEEVQTVFDFISQAIEADGIVFANSAYKTTYDAYSEAYYEGLSQDEIVKRLLDGPDRDVALVAAQLSIDERYDLSIKGLRDAMMSKGSWLTKYVPKAILVFHACRLEDKEHSLREDLKNAQTEGDQDREVEIMKDLMRVRKAIKAVKVRLGREK